jgi:hypothetical protein
MRYYREDVPKKSENKTKKFNFISIYLPFINKQIVRAMRRDTGRFFMTL